MSPRPLTRWLLLLCWIVPTAANWSDVPPKLPLPPWEDAGCNATGAPDTLRIGDLVMALRQADPMPADAPADARVYVALLDRDSTWHWAAVAAADTQRARQEIIPALALATDWHLLSLRWDECAYLWALVHEPTHLYDRWEPLLLPFRQDFMTRRDSLVAGLAARLPDYTFKLADLRSFSTQRRNLGRGYSATPLSHHQFGLATDIHFVHRGRLLHQRAAYQPVGEHAAQLGLVWGGNFKGFPDPAHVQLFSNSAALVQKFPLLAFEFEPFRPYYTDRVRSKLLAGQDADVRDTQDLLITLNAYRRNRACACAADSAFVPPDVTTTQQQLQRVGYQPARDVLLVASRPARTFTVIHPTIGTRSFQLGYWN